MDGDRGQGGDSSCLRRVLASTVAAVGAGAALGSRWRVLRRFRCFRRLQVNLTVTLRSQTSTSALCSGFVLSVTGSALPAPCSPGLACVETRR